MVGTGADAGLAADVQVTGGTFDGTTAEFWAELWNWVKSHLLGGAGASTCTTFTKTVTDYGKDGRPTRTTTNTYKVCTT
jgi:hypothetical protein